MQRNQVTKAKKKRLPEKERSSEKIVDDRALHRRKEEVVNRNQLQRGRIPREDAPIEVDSLSTKFPIVDWKTVVLTETFIMDVEQLFRLVKERYSSSAPEGFDLMLWGDLHTLFEPDEEDEIWKDQHE
ncbi:hypothetical protein Tco_0689232 [Tanacetum coccineum]